MRNIAPRDASELEALEQREWLESLDYVIKPLDYVIQQGDRGRVQRLLATLRHHARMTGVGAAVHGRHRLRQHASAPEEETPLPGSQEIERRIKSLVRWNAMAMVVRANRDVGRHRRPHLDLRLGGDALRSRLQPLLPRQGAATATATSSTSRATPRPASTRARSSKGGCRSRSWTTSAASSRPAAASRRTRIPWLMPDFWEFPTVSMGLGPIMSIYQARFNRYLEDRGLKKPSDAARSGRSSATARPTSPSRSARSAWRRARSSTT